MTKKYLTATMDNLDAWRLGECARETMKGPAGDLIDTGLILRRLLEEKGYGLVKLEGSVHEPSSPPKAGAATGPVAVFWIEEDGKIMLNPDVPQDEVVRAFIKVCNGAIEGAIQPLRALCQYIIDEPLIDEFGIKACVADGYDGHRSEQFEALIEAARKQLKT